MVYIYRFGVVEFDEGFHNVKERFEYDPTTCNINDVARGLLDKIDSGFVVIKDGDYLEQIGDYEGDVTVLMEEADARAERPSEYII